MSKYNKHSKSSKNELEVKKLFTTDLISVVSYLAIKNIGLSITPVNFCIERIASKLNPVVATISVSIFLPDEYPFSSDGGSAERDPRLSSPEPPRQRGASQRQQDFFLPLHCPKPGE